MKNSDVEIIENLSHNNEIFDIRWRVTTLCNYDCAFCIQGNRQDHLRQAKGESPALRMKICDEAIRLIEGTKEYDAVKFFLIGGELTILDDFPNLLEKIALCNFPREILFDITTNFSQDGDYYCRLCDIIQRKARGKKRSLTIRTSFYSDKTTKEKFVEKLLRVHEYAERNRLLESIDGERADVAISFTAGAPILNDADYDVLLWIRRKLEDVGIVAAPIFIRNFETNVSPAIIEKLLESNEEKSVRVTCLDGGIRMYSNIQALGMDLDGTRVFCPEGYACDAGIRNIWIDAFGHVKRRPTTGGSTSLGNILDGSVRLLDSPQVCFSDHCSCSQYGRIEKTNPSDEPNA